MSLEFVQPTSLVDACRILNDHTGDAKVIAGGTALVLMLRQRLIAPDVLVSLGRVSDSAYRGVELRRASMWIGGGETITSIASHSLIRDVLPLLAATCRVVGNVRIRNRATIAGNLAEADYASDLPATLVALNARCCIVGPFGRRDMAVVDLIRGFYETALEHGEVIEGIEIPLPLEDTGFAYVKYSARSSEDRPCVGVASTLTRRGGVVAAVRVVVGAAADTPQIRPDVLSEAIGRPITHELFEYISDAYATSIRPIDDVRASSWYRRQMVRVHVMRALKSANGEAP